MGKKYKQKWRCMRYRKGDVTHNLFVAARRYLHANQGSAMVMGGPAVVHESEFNFIVGIRCTGKPPVKKEKA